MGERPARVPEEALRTVRRIEIVALRLVEELFTGEYGSVFRGQGLEFAEVRPYEPGDDVRGIDWSVSARMGHAYIKRYVEERESVLMLLVDVSGSLRVGSRTLKSRYAAEIAALLALAAVKNNDKVGLILFTDRVEKYVPPRKGRRHVLRVVREILTYEPRHRATDLSAALDYLARVTRRRSIAFVLSDFHATGYEGALKRLSARHDITAVEIRDPIEAEVPDVGLVRWIDAESGQTRLTRGNSSARDLYRARREALDRARVGDVVVSTGESYVEPLLDFFRQRERRRQRA